MRYSKNGIQLTGTFEGRYTHAYPDPASPLGKELQARGLWQSALSTGVIASALLKLSGAPWTIGVGHTGPEVRYGLVWTDEQIDAQLLADVAGAEAAVNRLLAVQIAKGEISQNEFDALVDFVFNLGVGNFAGSTLLKLLLAGNDIAAANEFEKWDMAGGKHMAGLLRRRQAEKALFLGALAQ